MTEEMKDEINHSFEDKLIHDIHQFIHGRVGLNENVNALHDIMNTYSVDSCQIIQYLTTKKDIDLATKFLHYISDLDEIVNRFFGSPHFVDMFTTCLKTEPGISKIILALLIKTCNIADVPNIISQELMTILIAWISESEEDETYKSDIVQEIAKVSVEYCKFIAESIQTSILKYSDNSIVSLRYYSLFAHIMSIDSIRFDICQTYNGADLIFKLCMKNDILVQMIAFDYIILVTSTYSGIMYFLNNHLLKWLIDICVLKNKDVSDLTATEHDMTILCGQAMNSLLHILHMIETNYKQSILVSDVFRSQISYIPLCDTFVSYLTSSIESDKLIILHLISKYICTSDDVFQSILNNTYIVDGILRHMKSCQSNMKSVTLHCVASILLYPYIIANVEDMKQAGGGMGGATHDDVSTIHLEPSNDLINLSDTSSNTSLSPFALTFISPHHTSSNLIVIDNLKKTFIAKMSDVVGVSCIDHVFKLIRGPISEIRYGGYDVIRSLALQRSGWGLNVLMCVDGLMIYILDRTTETSKEGKEWKFSVISAMYHSPNKGMLPDVLSAQLDRMVKQGPFYVPATISDVAVMDS